MCPALGTICPSPHALDLTSCNCWPLTVSAHFPLYLSSITENTFHSFCHRQNQTSFKTQTKCHLLCDTSSSHCSRNNPYLFSAPPARFGSHGEIALITSLKVNYHISSFRDTHSYSALESGHALPLMASWSWKYSPSMLSWGYLTQQYFHIKETQNLFFTFTYSRRAFFSFLFSFGMIIHLIVRHLQLWAPLHL